MTSDDAMNVWGRGNGVVTAAIGEALVFFVFKKKKQNNIATTRQVAGSASDRAALSYRGSKPKAHRSGCEAALSGYLRG